MLYSHLFFSSFFLCAILFQPASAPGQFIQPAGHMPLGRAFHGAATLGDYTYVFGGSAFVGDVEQVPNSVMRAPVIAGRGLGQWEYTRSLPEPRYYISNATLVLNDTVYIVGGANGPDGDSLDTALWSRPGSDGHLSPWNYSPSFGQKLSSVTAVSTPGYIHIIGGYSYDATTREESVSREVLTSRIAADGSMSQWISGPQLPLPLWYHHAQVTQGRVYVWGGLSTPDFNSPDPSPYVFSATILASGRIGEWREERIRLPQPFYAGASAVAGPYLMTFSPRYAGPTLSNNVWWTFISSEGIQPWQPQQTEIPMRSYHAISADYRRGAIYVNGGRWERFGDKLPHVFSFQLSRAAKEAALASYESARAANSDAVAESTPSVNFAYERGGLPDYALPGFLTIENARQMSAEGKPMVLYFSAENARPCQDQRAELNQPRLQELTEKAAFAWVNAPDHPQLNQQLGVYRVPTWVFYDNNGEVRTKETGIMTIEEIAELVAQ